MAAASRILNAFSSSLAARMPGHDCPKESHA